MNVDGGEICVYPMVLDDGSFKKRSVLTLAAFPEKDDYQIIWNGTDSENDTLGSLTLIEDTSITLFMTPHGIPPTATPAPLPTISLTPGVVSVPPTLAPTPTPTPLPVLGTPGSPMNIQAEVQADGIKVSWDSPSNTGSSDINGYTISPFPSEINLQVPGTSDSVVVPSAYLLVGITYTFTVRASNSQGEGTESAYSNFVTYSAAAPTPTPGPTATLVPGSTPIPTATATSVPTPIPTPIIAVPTPTPVITPTPTPVPTVGPSPTPGLFSTPPVATGASVSASSGMLGDQIRFDMSGTDDQGVDRIYLWWTKPDGSTFYMSCGGSNDTVASCYSNYTLGYYDFSQAGTYTYKGMNIQDQHGIYADGSTTRQALYPSNPFNVPDIVVQGN